MTRLGLTRHNEQETIVFVKSENPDEACHKAIHQVCSHMRNEKDATTEKNSAEIIKLSKKAKGLISVTKLKIVSPYP